MIANAKFDSSGFAWSGSTLCVLVRHPAARYNLIEMKRGDWWTKKAREIRGMIAAEDGRSSALAGSHESQPLGENTGRVLPAYRTTAKGSDMDQDTQPLPTDVIRVLATENPRRYGTKSYRRFECYTGGMTVSEYEEEVRQQLGEAEARKCLNDLKWDSDRDRSIIRLERNGKPIELSIPTWLQHPWWAAEPS